MYLLQSMHICNLFIYLVRNIYFYLFLEGQFEWKVMNSLRRRQAGRNGNFVRAAAQIVSLITSRCVASLYNLPRYSYFLFYVFSTTLVPHTKQKDLLHSLALTLSQNLHPNYLPQGLRLYAEERVRPDSRWQVKDDVIQRKCSRSVNNIAFFNCCVSGAWDTGLQWLSLEARFEILIKGQLCCHSKRVNNH